MNSPLETRFLDKNEHELTTGETVSFDQNGETKQGVIFRLTKSAGIQIAVIKLGEEIIRKHPKEVTGE